MASPQSINFLIVLAQTNDRIKKLSQPKKQIFQIPWLPRSVFAVIDTVTHRDARGARGGQKDKQDLELFFAGVLG